MNGLTLRINKSKKVKNAFGFSPVVMSDGLILDVNKSLYETFVKSKSADEQLMVLKGFLNENKDICDLGVIKFFVSVFWQAELKHPVKCLIIRYVTKNYSVQEQFAKMLAEEIKTHTIHKHNEYKQYIDTVSKAATCIENFPSGMAAIKIAETDLTIYLRNCLECCISTLSKTKSLSPTEKNEIFNLAHLSLRLLLHIIQKINDSNIAKLSSEFVHIRLTIKHLLLDDDAPMDTKSVCGILILSMHLLENGADSWINILKPSEMNSDFNDLLNHDAAKLSLYSAVTTITTIERLQASNVNGEVAISKLTARILDVGERNSSESIFTLGVTRTLLQISKTLHKIIDNDVAMRVVDSLLIFVWNHLEHYMDSVKHLAAQIFNNIVKYSTKLKREGWGLQKLTPK